MMSQELSRSLKPRHIAMISIGGIVGAGLFVGSSAAIAATGPAVVLSYLITGTLVLLVMRCLGEMAVALPKLRSFTEFPRAGIGAWAGFVAGWLYWYFWAVTIPVEAIAGANIVHLWLPQISPTILGLGLMAIMTGVNLMSARSYGEFEFWFSSIKVAAILVFIVIASSFALGLAGPPGSGGFTGLTGYGGFMPQGVAAVLAGAVTVFFQLTGAEITTVAAAESSEPTRAVARMSTSVIVRILAFYVVSIFLIVSVTPWTSIKVGESPFSLVLMNMGFGWASSALSLVILTAVLSCLNSAFYVCSRVLFVLAEHGDAPPLLVRLNSRRVPVNSVWMSAVAGVLGVLATQTKAPVFSFLINNAGSIIVFVYMMVIVAQIRLRRERERLGEPEPAVTMWLFPWASYAALLAMAALLVAMAFSDKTSTDLYVSLGTLAVTVVIYLVVRASRGSSVRSSAA
jgi:GABA permease